MYNTSFLFMVSTECIQPRKIIGICGKERAWNPSVAAPQESNLFCRRDSAAVASSASVVVPGCVT